jgi:hypothetical protein
MNELANLAWFVMHLSMQKDLSAKRFLEGQDDIVIIYSFFGIKGAHLGVFRVTFFLLLLTRLTFGSVNFGGAVA